jgi:indole-3-glycerol phosphate synthase
VERARAELPEEVLRSSPLFAEKRRGFRAALERPGRRIVAEIKRASPSRGWIRAECDPAEIARAFANAGAAAISVLTEERFFHGSGEALRQVRRAVEVPLLRKDFVVDRYQLVEARALGADAVLLILALLEDGELEQFAGEAEELGLDVLAEVHDEVELRRALRAGARLIGINNRDLRTFETSLEVTERLARCAPDDALLVAESGIETPADLARLERCGVRAFLIGEALMRAEQPGQRLREFLEA